MLTVMPTATSTPARTTKADVNVNVVVEDVNLGGFFAIVDGLQRVNLNNLAHHHHQMCSWGSGNIRPGKLN